MMSPDQRVLELETNVDNWERRRFRRTLLVTILPLILAAALAWYALGQSGRDVGEIAAALDAVDAPAAADASAGGQAARVRAIGNELRALRPLPAEVEALEARVTSLGGELTALHDSQDRAETEIASLTGRLAEAAEADNVAGQRLAQLESDLDAAETARRALADELAERETRLANLRSALASKSLRAEEMSAALGTQGAFLAGAVEKLETTTARAETAEAGAAARDEEVRTLQRQLVDAQARREHLESELDAAHDVIASNAARVDAIGAALDTQGAFLASAVDKLHGATTRAEAAEARVADRDEEVRALRQRVVDAQDRHEHSVSELGTALDAARQRADEAEATARHRAEALAASEALRSEEIAHERELVAALQAQVARLDAAGPEPREEPPKVPAATQPPRENPAADQTLASAQAAQPTDDDAARTADRDALERELATVRSDSRREIASLREQLAERTRALAQADEGLRKMRLERDMLAGRLADAPDPALLEGLRAELAASRAMLADAEARRDMVASARDRLAERLSALQRDSETKVAALLDRQREQQETAAAELAAARSRITALNQDLAQAAQELETVRTRVAEFESSAATRESELKEAGARAADLHEQIATLRDDVGAKNEALSEAEAERAKAASRLEELRKARGQDQARVAALEADLARVRDDLRTRGSELTGARDAAAAGEREIHALRNELKAAHTSLDAAREQLTTQHARLAELERLLATSRGEVSARDAQVAGLKELAGSRSARLGELAATSKSLEADLAETKALLVEKLDLRDPRVRAIASQLGYSLEALTGDVVSTATEMEQARRSLVAEIKVNAPDADDLDYLRGSRIVLPSAVLFEPGQIELRERARAELGAIAARLRGAVSELPDELPWMLRVDGHSDDLPVRAGSYRDNWELSAARANVVAQFLIERGVPRDRIIVAGFADTQPIAIGTTDEARARNRRIELALTTR